VDNFIGPLIIQYKIPTTNAEYVISNLHFMTVICGKHVEFMGLMMVLA
jgi:hypothetical protein